MMSSEKKSEFIGVPSKYLFRWLAVATKPVSALFSYSTILQHDALIRINRAEGKSLLISDGSGRGELRKPPKHWQRESFCPPAH